MNSLLPLRIAIVHPYSNLSRAKGDASPLRTLDLLGSPLFPPHTTSSTTSSKNCWIHSILQVSLYTIVKLWLLCIPWILMFYYPPFTKSL